MKKIITLTFLALISSTGLFAQTDVDSKNSVTEEMPVFPGCEDVALDERNACFARHMMMHLARAFEYPDDARKEKIQGKVLLSYVVNKKGNITDVQVIKSVHPSIDAEAVRALLSAPQVKPATMNGEPVRMRFIIPINCVLQ